MSLPLSALLETLRRREAELDAARAESAALGAQLNTVRAQLAVLTDELEATNRGLIALHAELEEAREVEARLAAIVRSSDDAMFSVGPDGAIATWNAGAERLLGYAAAEVVGAAVDSVVPEPARGDFDDAVARLRAGEHGVRYVGDQTQRDGSTVEVAVTLAAIRDGDGRIGGYAVVMRDITERRRAARMMEAARAREALVAERERIARDLHDLVIQRLFAGAMALQVALDHGTPAELTQRVERAIGDINDTIAELRSTIFGLGQASQQPESLRARLLQTVARAAETLGFQPHVRFEGLVDTLVAPDVAEQLLAVAREALSNVARHAHATAVEVSLEVGDEVVLTVTDDGRGLGPVSRRSGLGNMASRAEGLGGSFLASSASGSGTRLEWRVPLNRS